jgi:hypothetical protein
MNGPDHLQLVKVAQDYDAGIRMQLSDAVYAVDDMISHSSTFCSWRVVDHAHQDMRLLARHLLLARSVAHPTGSNSAKYLGYR